MSDELLETQKQKSSGLLRGWQKNKNEGCDGQMWKFRELAAEKRADNQKTTQNPLLWNKTKEKEEKKTRLVPP